MTRILTFLFLAITTFSFAQPGAYKATSPQVVYEMFIECVEPLHKAYSGMSLTTHNPHLTGITIETMHHDAVVKLETFHKQRLHRDSYTAAKAYLAGIKELNVELIPVLNQIDSAKAEDNISPLLEQMHDITINQKELADDYKTAILKVIEMFKAEWDVWLEDEIIYFSRLTAQERNALYESGFGKEGLHSIKRRFYTAEYFVVNMHKDVTESRVNTIKASFHDLSELPEYMINNVDDFIAQVDEVMEQYRYKKTEQDNKVIYSKDKGTNLEFVVKKIEVKVISKSSNTVTVKFYY